jgi:polar amino acid transport system substrate-binding protein
MGGKIMKKCLIVIFCLFSGFALFSQQDTLSVVTEEWEDCTNKDETGLYFDIIREVFSPAYAIKIGIMPYTQSIKKVQDKNADMFLGSYLDEVTKVIYPKWHFAADDITVVYLKDSIKKWDGEKSLAGKKVAWIRGYTFNDYIKVKMTVSIQDKRDFAINMLTKKRIDFFIDNLSDITSTIEGMKLDTGRFKTDLLMHLDLYIGFIDSDRGKSLAAFWDREFGKKVKNGKIKELFKKWDQLYDYNF